MNVYRWVYNCMYIDCVEMKGKCEPYEGGGWGMGWEMFM